MTGTRSRPEHAHFPVRESTVVERCHRDRVGYLVVREAHGRPHHERVAVPGPFSFAFGQRVTLWRSDSRGPRSHSCRRISRRRVATSGSSLAALSAFNHDAVPRSDPYKRDGAFVYLLVNVAAELERAAAPHIES